MDKRGNDRAKIQVHRQAFSLFLPLYLDDQHSGIYDLFHELYGRKPIQKPMQRFCQSLDNYDGPWRRVSPAPSDLPAGADIDDLDRFLAHRPEDRDPKRFLPEDWGLNPDPTKLSTAPLSAPHALYGEAQYFHGFIRRLVYTPQGQDDKRPAYKLYERRDIVAVAVELAEWNETVKRTQHFRTLSAVTKLQLAVFQSGVVFLIVELDTCANHPDNRDQRIDLADDMLPHICRTDLLGRQTNFDYDELCDESGHRPSTRPLDQAMWLNTRMRRLFAPYLNSQDPNAALPELPHSVTWFVRKSQSPESPCLVPLHKPGNLGSAPDTLKRFSGVGYDRRMILPHYFDLLPEVMKVNGRLHDHWRSPADDRMYAHIAMGLNNPSALTEAQKYRLAFLEPPGDGPDDAYPYNPSFVADQLSCQKLYYERFSDRGTTYATSPYSFLAIMEDKQKPSVFFDHSVRHYFIFSLLIQMQRAHLLAYSNWLSQSVTKLRDNKRCEYRSAIKQISVEILNFRHNYWFTGVSPQIQGNEMYLQMRAAVGLDALFNEVVSEADSAKAAIDQLNSQRSNFWQIVLSLAAVCLALTTVPDALFEPDLPWWSMFTSWCKELFQ